MRTKYCEHIIEEGEHQGQKCGVAFRVNFAPTNAHKKYCPEHDSDLLKSGLHASKNLHAIQGNKDMMIDFVKKSMTFQPKRDKELADAIVSIERLKLAIADSNNDDNTRICNLIDQNIIKILNSLGILNEESEVEFATRRQLLAVQSQLRNLDARITALENE